MAAYLEDYVARYELPVRTRTRVDHLSGAGNRFIVRTGDRRLECDQVVVAMSDFQKPKVPAFADQLDPGIVQLH